MFTGLIQSVGQIEAIERTEAGLELRVGCAYHDLQPGESMAVNGACLTVRDQGPGFFTVAAIATTLSRTAIGGWRPGKRVNLERALKVGDRLGGHIVQGHVDGVGRVEAAIRSEDALLLDVRVGPELWRLMVDHGSVAVDGVSLTVNQLASPGVLQVALIEYTLAHTALADVSAGDEVHIEADMLGKYVQRLLSPYGSEANPRGE